MKTQRGSQPLLKEKLHRLKLKLFYGECPKCGDRMSLTQLFYHTAYRQCRVYNPNERERGRQKLSKKKH